MKKLMIASACILALSMGGAFAQSQPAPGASSEANVGATGTTKHMGKTKHMKSAKHMTKHPKAGTTVGMGSGSAHGKQPAARY